MPCIGREALSYAPPEVTTGLVVRRREHPDERVRVKPSLATGPEVVLAYAGKSVVLRSVESTSPSS